jgi:hypothetical protein
MPIQRCALCHDWRRIGLSLDATANPPQRKTPKLTLPDEDAVTRFHVYEDVSDLYLDDIEELHAVLTGACRRVEMESEEFANITTDNISAIKVEYLKGVIIRARDPLDARVSIGTDNSPKVSVIITGNQKLVNALNATLDPFFRTRQRFLTRRLLLARSIQFWVLTIILGFAFVALAEWLFPDLPDLVPLLVLIASLALSVTTLGHAPAVVVRPIWKRDRPSHPPINWRDKAVDFTQGLVILIIGFCLGKYL